MKNRTFLLGLVVLLFASSAQAQQDPMFTKYMFNTLIFNPGYAGTKEHMTATLLHRSQWVEIDGAPTTQTFTIHSPLKGKKISLGGSLLHDQIGPTKDIKLTSYYAYRIELSERSKLSFGLSASYNSYRTEFESITLANPVDEAFLNSYSKSYFNAGAGLFYYNEHFYAGLSVPHLLNASLIDPDRTVPQDEFKAERVRHYYLSAGLILPLNTSMVFKPSILIKNANLFGELGNSYRATVGAPTEFDIDLSLLMYDALWIGTAFRSSFEYFSGESSTASFDIWAAYYLRNNMTIGVAYDFPLNEISKVSSGSFEIIMGYDFAYKTSKILTPRYFF